MIVSLTILLRGKLMTTIQIELTEEDKKALDYIQAATDSDLDDNQFDAEKIKDLCAYYCQLVNAKYQQLKNTKSA